MLLVDFKKCINNIHMNQPFPGRREDFPTQQAYENWQRREIKQLTELMNTLMLMKPDLALNSANQSDVKCSKPSSWYSSRISLTGIVACRFGAEHICVCSKRSAITVPFADENVHRFRSRSCA